MNYSQQHSSGCKELPSKCYCDVDWIWKRSLISEKTNANRSGKWMLFPSRTTVDTIWEKITELLDDGFLGHVAKVSPVRDSTKAEDHLICIYTDNHENIDDVWRVLMSIRLLIPGQKYGVLNYKTDDATYSGDYCGTIVKRHRNQLVSKYTSPKIPFIGDKSGNNIDYNYNPQLRMNNVGVNYGKIIVREYISQLNSDNKPVDLTLTKKSSDNKKIKIVKYNKNEMSNQIVNDESDLSNVAENDNLNKWDLTCGIVDTKNETEVVIDPSLTRFNNREKEKKRKSINDDNNQFNSPMHDNDWF
eukprot:gene11552-15472_t